MGRVNEREHDETSEPAPTGRDGHQNGHQDAGRDADAGTEAADEDARDEQPVTPQLTPAQSRRLSQPMVGILLSVLVTVGAVAVLMLMNPSPDPEPFTPDEDVEAAAGPVADVAGFAPVVPQVPDDWTANYARWKGGEEVPHWEAGYTTSETDFVGFAQTDAANPTWIAQEVDQAPEAGTTTLEGMELTIRRDEDADREHFVLDAAENTVDGTTVVISGDADDAEFDAALRAILAGLGEGPAADGSPSAP
ncbi:hypothetical protein GCM10027060_06620 [Nesterenkonia halophila]